MSEELAVLKEDLCKIIKSINNVKLLKYLISFTKLALEKWGH